MFFRNKILAFVVACVLAACGGGSDEQPPPGTDVVAVAQPFQTARAAAEAYMATPPLVYPTHYDGIPGDDGTTWVTVRHEGKIVYDRLLGSFDYYEGKMSDGTVIKWVTEYYTYSPPIEVVMVGDKAFMLPQMTVERNGSPRQVLVYDLSEGAGADWIIIYGEEVLHPGDEGQPQQLWAVLNYKTGQIIEYGHYAVPELQEQPVVEVVPQTAKHAYEIYQETPVIIDEVEDTPFVELDNGTYHGTIVIKGQTVYDAVVANYVYQAGRLSDGAPISVIWEYNDGYLPTATWLILGNKKFPMTFHAVRGGQPRNIVVIDVSEGIGSDWLLIYGAEVNEAMNEESSPLSYWALINRHTGEIVELGYYDPPSPIM